MSKKILIIGAGPAGLSCAYKLVEAGNHDIKYHEKADVVGMIRQVNS